MSAAEAVHMCSNKQVCYFKAPPKLRLKYKLNKSSLITWLKLLPLLSFSDSLNLRGASVPLILVPTHARLAPLSLSSRLQQGHMHVCACESVVCPRWCRIFSCSCSQNSSWPGLNRCDEARGTTSRDQIMRHKEETSSPPVLSRFLDLREMFVCCHVLNVHLCGCVSNAPLVLIKWKSRSRIRTNILKHSIFVQSVKQRSDWSGNYHMTLVG